MALQQFQRLGMEAEIRIVKTSGDMFLDKPLHQLSGQGVFVREIDEHMLAGEVELAVHSMKDLPSKRPESLPIGAVLARDSPYDVLVSGEGRSLEELKNGAVVGTSSMRRSAQLLRTRPDLKPRSIRGNLQTRIRKLEGGGYDALILAEAGLQRMGYRVPYQRLDPESFIPSANQGTIAVVCRAGSSGETAARRIDHLPTRKETMVERRILEIVGGGCVVPVAVHAHSRGDDLRVMAEILSLDGKRYVRVDEDVTGDDWSKVEELGRMLLETGGRDLVKEAVAHVSR